ncbi:conserved hypothetical protein, partial [Ricinus communis]
MALAVEETIEQRLAPIGHRERRQPAGGTETLGELHQFIELLAEIVPGRRLQ